MRARDEAGQARGAGTDMDGDALGDGWFVRAAGVVGDLNNPFYREERQRDVWNEASAVGYQLVLWLGMAAAAAMVWSGGATALPYAVVLYGVVGVSAGVTMAYSRALGVSGTEGFRMLQVRMPVYALLLAAFVVGAARAVPDGQGGFVGGLSDGAVIGAGIAAVALVVAGVRASRRARRHHA